MAASLSCPYCGRVLSMPSQVGLITCDGCERRFEPTKLRYQPAGPLKRITGWILLILGLLLLLGGISATLNFDFQDRDTPMRMVGAFLLPAIFIFTGLALKRGKKVIEAPLPEAELKSNDA